MKKIKVNNKIDNVNNETISLMKRLKALQEQLEVYEALKKEAGRIKERIKALYPEGGTFVYDNDVLTVERKMVTRYRIPEELKDKLAYQSPVYYISVRPITKD